MKKWILVLLACTLFSCAPQENKKASTLNYFDIEGYFKAEVQRLQRNAPIVEKEVLVKGKAERKVVKIASWQTELAGFIGADINKASWRSEFTKTFQNGLTAYSTNNNKIPVKKIEIVQDGNKVTGVRIFKLSQNYLYTSTDTLLYYPDSLYFIQNNQKIKLLSPKTYRVLGKFGR